MRRVFVKQVWSRLVGHLYLAADVLVWNDHRVAIVGPHRVEMWRKNNLHTIGVPERSAWKNSDSLDRWSTVSSWKAYNNYVPELGTICYVRTQLHIDCRSIQPHYRTDAEQQDSC